METKETAIIYARTANASDSPDERIVEQISTCQQYAQEQRWTVAQVSSDSGCPGLSFDRPGFRQAMAYIDLHLEVTRLVAVSPDRLSRNIPHLLELEAGLSARGISVEYAKSNPLATSVGDKMMLAVMSAVDAFVARTQLTAKGSQHG